MTCKLCEQDVSREERLGMLGHPVGGGGVERFVACTARPAVLPLTCIDPFVPNPRAYDLCYLATPYSKFPAGLDAAFEEAARLAGHLMLAGVRVYCPIAHCHPLATFAGIDPLNHAVWIPFDEAQMRVARCLIVAQMSTWSISYGIAHEIKVFETANKPVVYLDPTTMRLARVPFAGLA